MQQCFRWYLCILLAVCTTSFARDLNPNPPISVVPRPAILKMRHGQFTLTPRSRIVLTSSDPRLRWNADYLQQILSASTGYDIKVTSDSNAPCGMNIVFESSANCDMGKEGYELNITPHSIRILSQTPEGNFYGCQTLRQLLPTDIESKFVVQRIWQVPCCRILDMPGFGWRGMHLDVSRHFFDKEFIKKYLDTLAMYKINVFHWHLTDDEGWRIEIKKYPKLTEIGAWRGPKPDVYGGFYTQNDIREIVAYAKNHNITIIPEIEMPGHCNAAFYAYPELSCSGKVLKTGNDNSRFYFLAENRFAYCAGKETTYSFLEEVLSEVADLFESPYIHIGGDERPESVWDRCEFCKKKMQEQGLKNAEELQQYFIGRIEKFLISKQKRLIGWDQITTEKLAKSSVVISYQSTEPGIRMAKAGNDVILALSGNCYFDWYQSTRPDEPEAIGGMVSLKTAYSLNPHLDGLNAQEQSHILGAQGCLWTEYVKTTSHVEYMTFPRVCATAEVLWSPEKVRDWDDFVMRISSQYERFDRLGVNYRRYSEDDVFEPHDEAKLKYKVVVRTNMPVYKNYSPKYAFDSDQRTFFFTNNFVKKGDYFEVILDKSLKAKAVVVCTGSRMNYLHSGAVEISADANNFITVADFKDKGFAKAQFESPKEIKAIRIKVTEDQSDWLIIREIELLNE